ncbi:MAG: cation diffusion facilitator family transporter [Balneolales bacterium]
MASRSQKAIKISLFVSFVAFAFKFGGFIMTGSNSVLSDALESFVHVFAVGFSTFGVYLSVKPPDEDHHYGHERIGFFAVGTEGLLIIFAGITIIVQSVNNLITGAVLVNLDEGIAVILLAGLVNLALGSYLIKVGREENNMILRGNGKHTLTDVWTSGGVVLTLVLIRFTGWVILDAIVALCVASYIMYEGIKLIRYALKGLMDSRDPDKDKIIKEILSQNLPPNIISTHNLRHRTTGNTTWVEFHALFKKDIKLQIAHDEATILERNIMKAIWGDAVVTIHLEPAETHAQSHFILEGVNRNKDLDDLF